MKSLFLGSAAALIAVTGAQAADMPMTPAREPVYQCDIAGFYEIPGSDICLRISGFARFWMGGSDRDGLLYGGKVGNGLGTGPGGADDAFFMASDFRVRFDARSATSYGTVRAFAELQAQDNGQNTGGALNLRQAFVQFGNWVFGKTGSTFTVNRTGANYTNALSTLDAITVRVTQVRYTQPFGNGFAVSVAIENPGFRGIEGAPPFGGNELNVVTGVNEIPNFVANLAYTGDRVAASLGAAIVYNERFDGVGSDEDTGYAFQGSIEFAATDALTIGLLGNYAEGADEYVNDNLRANNNVAMNGLGAITNQSEVWAVNGFITYAFSPTLATNIILGYGERDGASALVDASFDHFAGTANLVWTPVDNLEFILEYTYADTDFTAPGAADFEDHLVVFQARRSF